MKCNIVNYKNIDQLELELSEGKLNFIYGVSGSGKSSISEAISNVINEKEFKESEKKIDAVNDIEVTVNVSKKSELEIFDNESINDFIFSRDYEGLYEVFYKPNEVLKNLEKPLSEFLDSNDIKKIKEKLSLFIYQFDSLVDGLKISFTKNDVKNVGIIKNLSNEVLYCNHEYTNKQIKWLNDGLQYLLIDENESGNILTKCPFCQDVTVTTQRIKDITKIQSLKPESIKEVENKTNLLIELEFDYNGLNDIQDFESFKSQLFSFKRMYDSAKEVNDFLTINYKNSFTNVPNVDESLNEYFLNKGINIKETFEIFKRELTNYHNQVRRYQGIFSSMLDQKIGIINQHINMLGIKYEFIKKNPLDKSDKYFFKHKNDTKSESIDLSENLSTGEKNIVSLILFLLINQTKSVIIDDPASSFDEYKRRQILGLIQEQRKNAPFTLVLSHDQIFLKFLMMEDEQKRKLKQETTWNILFLEKKNSVSIKKIHTADMDTLVAHVEHAVQESTTYEEKIINLRMFYEITDRHGDTYKYLSGIMHCEKNCNAEEITQKEFIQGMLEKSGFEEMDILKQINSRFSDLKLSEFESINLKDTFSNLGDFEKIILCRENVTDKNQQKVLNDVVHFNYGLVHMINPYKYNFQSEEAYTIIDSYNP